MLQEKQHFEGKDETDFISLFVLLEPLWIEWIKQLIINQLTLRY